MINKIRKHNGAASMKTGTAGSRDTLRVDFSYAFAPPHRLTVALPDSSDKTLLNLVPEYLNMAWTYDNLVNKPLTAYMPPKTEWQVDLKPSLDGQPFAQSRWSRVEGWLPALENVYGDERTSMRLEVVGGRSAAIVRVEVVNADEKPHRIELRCEKQPAGWNGVNPAWVQPEWDNDVLLASWLERADRVLVFAVGGDEKPVLAPTTVCLAWNLGPCEKRSAWIVRPYKAYQSILPTLRRIDWSREFEEAKQTWRALLDRAAGMSIPDKGVENAFRAGLADCFIMREPVADGTVAACPGTECYRATEPFEPLIVSVLLDQASLHAEASENSQMVIDQQGPDGDWADPQGWCHSMWGASGMKAWAIMEHYRMTGDKEYLAAVFPRMAASSRWQERERAKTRKLVNGERPLTYGLMPRGNGDCGLMNDNDKYGVFLPHNILAVYADALTVEAATISGRTDDLPEFQRIHKTALEDLLRAIEQGAISENGYRWIPGVAGKTSGSRWGALYAAFPCRFLPPHHELIDGTIRKMESRLSPGGIPVHTGWMQDGMWVAITLDNLAEALLLRDDGDAAVKYLYAVLNHGTPLYSWCEERGLEAGAKETSGDRQHLWTPVAVGRFIRDAMVMEDGDTLHLARGTARHWLGSGRPLSVRGMPTHFGRVSYEMRYDEKAREVTGRIELSGSSAPCMKLHLRLPERLKIRCLNKVPGATIGSDGTTIEWRNLTGVACFDVAVGVEGMAQEH